MINKEHLGNNKRADNFLEKHIAGGNRIHRKKQTNFKLSRKIIKLYEK